MTYEFSALMFSYPSFETMVVHREMVFAHTYLLPGLPLPGTVPVVSEIDK